MKIGIVGAGAMGSVYGGLFAAAGHDVWLVDVWREHVEAIRRGGLHVSGVSGERVVETAARTPGIVYIRTTRPKTKVVYANEEAFPVGGSKTLRSSERDAVTVVAAGITVFEALAAHAELGKQGIAVRVIDLYSVKPLDEATLRKAAAETRALVTVEDHSVFGGIGEAVERHSVLAELQLGVQLDRLADPRQALQGRGCHGDQIADPAHVDDGVIIADRSQHAPQMGDHARRSASRRSCAAIWARPARKCAWQMATASASAASATTVPAPGSMADA